MDAAEPVCPPYAEVVKALTDFGEIQVGHAVDHMDLLAELWARPDGQTWTIILRMPDGTTCIADYGMDWTPPPGEPS